MTRAGKHGSAVYEGLDLPAVDPPRTRWYVRPDNPTNRPTEHEGVTEKRHAELLAKGWREVIVDGEGYGEPGSEFDESGFPLDPSVPATPDEDPDLSHGPRGESGDAAGLGLGDDLESQLRALMGNEGEQSND